MLRSLAPALVLVLALTLPAAAAFSSTTRDLLIAYDADATPVVVVSGAISIEGALAGQLLVAGSTATALDDVETLVVTENGNVFEVHGATLEVSRGALLWRFGAGSLGLDVAAPYAIGLALPQAPIPTETGEVSAGFLLVSEAIAGTAAWSAGSVELIPIDAIVTIRDARGDPLPEWEARRVNPQVTNAGETAVRTVAFRADGPFQARIGATIVAGAAGDAADLTLAVSSGAEDRFAETLEILDRAAGDFSDEPPSFSGDNGPLAVLERVSGILNGALILVPGDGSSAEAIPLEARWGEEEFAVGAFNVVRGDGMQVAWSKGEMRLEGEPTVALGREGFAVDPPMSLWIFPFVSLGLWALAIGAIVWWTVDRPPKGAPDRVARLASFLVYALALMGALYLWDKSFTQTFGTGALAVARESGISPATLPQIGTLAVVELIPWGIAGFLFALPVRIGLGIALRYLGRGKSYKGLASAGGLVALAILGPIYALWCFNLIWAQAGRAIAGP